MSGHDGKLEQRMEGEKPLPESPRKNSSQNLMIDRVREMGDRQVSKLTANFLTWVN